MTPSGVTSARVRNYVRVPRRQDVKKKMRIEVSPLRLGDRQMVLVFRGSKRTVDTAMKIMVRYLEKGAKK